MEIVIALPQDIDKLCRTCMHFMEDDQKYCVTCEDNNESSELYKMLSFLTDTNDSFNEYLPKFMCNGCVKKLEISYLFKQQCQNTYINFRDIMNSAENLKSDISDFICSTCEECFSTQYKLSKHEIKHNKTINLLTRYKCETGEDKKYIINNHNTETLSLVTERKEQISEDDTKSVLEEASGIVPNEAIIDQKEQYNDNKSKTCDLCDRKFNNDLALQLHFVNHAILAEGDTDPDIFDQYFLCPTCGETFSSSEDLKNHITKCCLEQKGFKCFKCDQIFDSELNMLKHEKEFVHTINYLCEKQNGEKKLYVCPICSEEFTGKEELNLHSVRHIIKKITCRICKKTFSCQIAHNNHLKSHPNYKHKCNLCGKWLGSRHALKTHVMGVHSVAKNFVCSVCSKAFKTPSRLYIHKLTHREDKKFICSICSYKTNYVGDFRVHNRIHTAERPYKCNFVNCKRQFKTSSHLNEHIQRHLQIKKYQCNMCCMVFGHNHTLKMHLLVHTGEKPFSCSICKVKFRRKHHLKNHMKQHANIENSNNLQI